MTDGTLGPRTITLLCMRAGGKLVGMLPYKGHNMCSDVKSGDVLNTITALFLSRVYYMYSLDCTLCNLAM